MIEVDVRIVLDIEDLDSLTAEHVAERVFEIAARHESAKKLWEIGTFHDSFISKVRTKDGVILKNKFSYLKEDKNLNQDNTKKDDPDNGIFNLGKEFPIPFD